MRKGEYIGVAKKEDKQAIAQIWREVFTSERLYLSIIFNDLYPHLTPFVYKIGDKVFSIAFAIPLSIGELKGEYIYGVATKREARGGGLASSLINHMESHFKNRGENFLLLRPAEEPLFEYYLKLGFTLPLKRSEISIKIEKEGLSPLKKRRRFSQLTPLLLQRRREAMALPIYLWPKGVYKSIINLALLDNGCTYNFRYKDSSEYLIARADYTSAECVVIEEASPLLKDKNALLDKELVSLLCKAALSINEEAKRISLYAPAINGEDSAGFALAKPLTASPRILERIKGGFFNFTME